jgi:hypothetical protein
MTTRYRTARDWSRLDYVIARRAAAHRTNRSESDANRDLWAETPAGIAARIAAARIAEREAGRRGLPCNDPHERAGASLVAPRLGTVDDWTD